MVTGCAGFIGSSLVRALLDRGDEVVGVDNFCTGKRTNIAGLAPFTCIEGDLLDMAVAEEACRGVDVIYHHAAIPFGPQSLSTPNNDANVTATLNILLAAQKTKVRRIVYAGSYSAYGESRNLPNREDMAPDPVSPYAVSKLVGEYYMKSFHRVYGMETVVLRYFNVFGPRQDENSPYSGALARVIVRMLAHQHPVIDGDGSQTREFTYVDDVVQANLLAGHAKASYVAGQVLNVATGAPVSFNEVLDILNGLIRYRGSVPEFRCLADGQIRESLADISKARRLLNYRPEVDVREGLRRTVNWYEGFMQNQLGMAEAPAFA